MVESGAVSSRPDCSCRCCRAVLHHRSFLLLQHCSTAPLQAWFRYCITRQAGPSCSRQVSDSTLGLQPAAAPGSGPPPGRCTASLLRLPAAALPRCPASRPAGREPATTHKLPSLPGPLCGEAAPVQTCCLARRPGLYTRGKVVNMCGCITSR